MLDSGLDDPAARRASISRWQQSGASTADAIACFDRLPAATLGGVKGRWRGSGLATGHPLDGLLEAFGWYGKDFLDPETVHPLLFQRPGGPIHALNPAWIPIGLAVRYAGVLHSRWLQRVVALGQPLLATSRPKARLRMIEHRAVLSVGMIYDDLPIVDLFRTVDPDTLVGLMDLRSMAQPFFFLLRRDSRPASAAPPPR